MTSIDVQPVHGAPLGARIYGIDLAEPLDGSTVKALHRALLDFHVLIFPDQTMNDDQQITFSEHWGKLQVHVLNQYVQESRPEVFIITNLDKDGKPIGEHPDPGAAIWHTDGSWSGTRGLVTMLHAQRIPATGGDTLFANLRSAYDDLGDDDKALIEDAIAIHDLNYSRSKTIARTQMTEEQKRAAPPVEWPVMRVHPETGRKVLYLGQHAASIKGMSVEDGRALIDRLNAHATQDQYVYRHVWKAAEVVMWDNRAVFHLATDFDWSNDVRILRRTTTVGERLSMGLGL